MANITQRKHIGRVAAALGSALATLGFFVAVANGPQPVAASLSTATSAAQQTPSMTSASPSASSSRDPQIASRSTQGSGLRSNAQQSAPRLRTRGS